MIKVHFTSGLGNQLYQYFYAESLKKHLKKNDFCFYDSCLPPYQQNIWDIFDYDSNEFFNQSAIKKFNLTKYLRVYFFKFLIYLKINKFFKIYSDQDDYNLILFNKLNINIDIYGYWQKTKFIENYKNMKKKLTFKSKLNLLHLDPSLKLYSDIVGVHIRGGDFLFRQNKDYLIGINTEYYFDNIQKFIKILENPVFIFFTDDVKYLKKLIRNTEFPHRFIFEISKNRKHDFQYLSLCDHFILPNSTFGSWAAFFSENKNKIIINPINPLINDMLNQ